VFIVEMTLKLLVWGPERLFTSGWHTFDLISSIAFVLAIFLAGFVPAWDEVLTFVRPLRLLRLFKLKKRYRDVFGTLFILIPPMSSAASVLLMLYYFFAIVGMELFSGIGLRNCCNGTLLEPYYADPGPDSSTFALRYYLNTFTVRRRRRELYLRSY
jgi:two pore calcium channel protein 1